MSHKLVPLSSLVPSSDNPRRAIDPSRIEGLAESIRADGVLQNLVVEACPESRYRVIAGTRRFEALSLLKSRGDIDDTYKVPVEIRRDLDDARLMRIATVENVQREPLDPIDEADAFAALLQNGAAIDDVAAQTGVSSRTVKRRVALAGLSPAAKDATRSGTIPHSVAEALTLGTEDQQRLVLQMLEEGAYLDAECVREMLLDGKPTVASAIFPLDHYIGTTTGDLFAEAETTYFDDVEQFLSLQKRAVEALAETHRQTAKWVDVVSLGFVPWWQYGEAEEGETGGVVINLRPNGAVEIRTGLVRHQVNEQVAEETAAAVPQVRERPPYSRPTLRYVGAHKSVAVLGSLVSSPRKAKEVAAVLLLSQGTHGSPVRVEPHPALRYFEADDNPPQGYRIVDGLARRFAEKLGRSNGEVEAAWRSLPSGASHATLYESVGKLTNRDLSLMVSYLVILGFGQRDVERLDTEDSVFNRVAANLSISMRQWWTPDEAFLLGLKRSELEAIAVESGAIQRIGRPARLKKTELVQSLARYFERTANKQAALDEHDQKGRDWLPGVMRFPAEAPEKNQPMS